MSQRADSGSHLLKDEAAGPLLLHAGRALPRSGGRETLPLPGARGEGSRVPTAKARLGGMVPDGQMSPDAWPPLPQAHSIWLPGCRSCPSAHWAGPAHRLPGPGDPGAISFSFFWRISTAGGVYQAEFKNKQTNNTHHTLKHPQSEENGFIRESASSQPQGRWAGRGSPW